MIDQIRIQNLRSIKDSEDIKLRPINILLGANSSGKSTFLRSFPLIKQSIEKALQGSISWYDPYSVDFGDYETSKNRFSKKDEGITFCYKIKEATAIGQVSFTYLFEDKIDIQEFDNSEISFTLRNDSKGTFISDIKCYIKATEIELFVEGRDKNITIKLDGEVINLSEELQFFQLGLHSILPFIKKAGETPFANGNTFVNHALDKIHTLVKRTCSHYVKDTRINSIFLNSKFYGREAFLQHIKEEKNLSSFAKKICNWTLDTAEYKTLYNCYLLIKLNSIIGTFDTEIYSLYYFCQYMAPLRAEAERYYRTQGLQVSSLNENGNNLVEYIESIQTKKGYGEFVQEVLGIKVKIKQNEGLKSLMLVNDNGEFSITDVGFGYTQILPIVTKLWEVADKRISLTEKVNGRTRKPMTVLSIEQPELHLHPAMQAKIADAFIKIVEHTHKEEKKEIRLLIETHSPTMINRIGRRIREGILSPNDVNVILFEKDSNQQNSIIKQIEFTKDGQLQNWPYGFLDPKD